MTLSDFVFLKSPAPAPSVPVLPLHVEGIRLRTTNGKEWTGVSQTTFTLAQAECEGQDTDAFMAAIAKLGTKVPRLICNYDADDNNVGIGRFNAFVIPDFPQRMRALAIRAAEQHGLLIQFTAFADQQRPVFAGVDRPAFWRALCAGLEGVPAIADWGNERPKNGMGPNDDTPLIGPVLPGSNSLLFSRGSNLGDQLPPLPSLPIGISMGHPNRDDFVRRAGKTAIDWRTGDTTEHLSVPGVIGWDEWIGLGEVDEPGRTCANPWQMYQAACWALMAGVPLLNAHTRNSISSLTLPGPLASESIRAMAQACRETPTTYAEGQLERGNSPWQTQNGNLPFLHFDSETITGPDGTVCPGNRSIGAKRSYALWIGNECLFTPIEPMPDWKPETMLRPGFTIVDSWGYGNNVHTVYRVTR